MRRSQFTAGSSGTAAGSRQQQWQWQRPSPQASPVHRVLQVGSAAMIVPARVAGMVPRAAVLVIVRVIVRVITRVRVGVLLLSVRVAVAVPAVCRAAQHCTPRLQRRGASRGQPTALPGSAAQ